MARFKVYAEITNLTRVNFLTGIQRVVISLISRLARREDADLCLLSYDAQKQAFLKVDTEAFSDYFIDRVCPKSHIFTNTYFGLDELDAGSIFLDIDSIWNTELTRSYLYPILKNSGIKIINMVYDISPINFPQFSYEATILKFITYIGAVIKYSDMVITNTKAVENDFLELCQKTKSKPPKTAVVMLGTDFKKQTIENLEITYHTNSRGETVPDAEFENLIVDPEVEKWANMGKYVLMVGTIEPRKNHKAVLDALDAGMKANVIFAGKLGWNIEDLTQRIINHPLYGKRLFMVNNANDATIDMLYKKAYFLAFPTFNEGFGLPMVESFSKGLPVIASDIPVLREVGGDFADYFDNKNPKALTDYVNKMLENPEKYKAKKENLKNYKPFTWDEAENKLYKILLEYSEQKGKVPDDLKIKQMVVLTARNQDILNSLPFVEHYMPFIRELVVCTPPQNVLEFKSQYKGRLKLTFLTDDMILNGSKLPEDHLARNFYLRCLAMKRPEIDDVFIMSDDDYRPLVPIDKSVFISNGRYVGYYCYDIKKWQGRYGSYTSYDVGHFRTCDFLEKNGYATMQYSSHQPQIIDKQIFLEIMQVHPGIESMGFDEWSTYFNIAMKLHPEKFCSHVYTTMCWPGTLASWNLYKVPQPFLFENYYEGLYSGRSVFAGFSKTFCENQDKENHEKMRIFSNEIKKQYDARKVYDSYSRIYADKCGEYPSFVIMWDKNSKHIKIHVPSFLELQSDAWTRIPVTVLGDIWSCFPGKVLNIQYHFFNKNQISVLSSREIKTENAVQHFMIPVKTPKSRVPGAKFIFCITADNPLTEEEEQIYLEKGRLPEDRGRTEDARRAVPLILA